MSETQSTVVECADTNTHYIYNVYMDVLRILYSVNTQTHTHHIPLRIHIVPTWRKTSFQPAGRHHSSLLEDTVPVGWNGVLYYAYIIIYSIKSLISIHSQ